MIRASSPPHRLAGRCAAGLALAALLAAGCAGTTLSFTRMVSYEPTAEANYKKGMVELSDENFLEAQKYFNHIKNKFPFSRFATLAELRLADTYYAEEKYIDAVDAYRQFIRFHPTHPDVQSGYAAHRVCSSYVKQIPSDWFLVPPSHEKDLAATRDALRELAAFQRTYPNSEYQDEVAQMKRRAIRHIADHELYVARFYLERDKPKAAILRLENLLKAHPDAGIDTEAMLLLGKTYLAMKKRDQARQTFSQMVDEYPKDPYSEKARLYLKHLGPAK